MRDEGTTVNDVAERGLSQASKSGRPSVWDAGRLAAGNQLADQSRGRFDKGVQPSLLTLSWFKVSVLTASSGTDDSLESTDSLQPALFRAFLAQINNHA